MAEPEEISDPERESLIHENSDKIHAADDTSSSSVSDYEEKRPAPPSAVKRKVYRLFGREKPVHKVFGGGKHLAMENHSMNARLARRHEEIRQMRARNQATRIVESDADSDDENEAAPILIGNVEAGSSNRPKRSRITATVPNEQADTGPINTEPVTTETLISPGFSYTETVVIPPQPSVFHNDPPGCGSTFFQAAVCPRDYQMYLDTSFNRREKVLHASIVQSATVAHTIIHDHRHLMQQHHLLQQQYQQLDHTHQQLTQQFQDFHGQHSGCSQLAEELNQLRVSAEEEKTHLKQEIDHLQLIAEQERNNHHRAMARAGRRAVRAFRESAAGKTWVEDRSADWFTTGFSRCEAQFLQSGLFPPDSDLSFLEMGKPMTDEIPTPAFNPGPFSDEEEEE